MADESFKEFVLDQLAALPELRAKAMFGAHGIYSGEHFFGILAEGRIYFKVDATTKGDYEARGMSPFTYEVKGRPTTMSYYEVPPEILEDRHAVIVWANQAIQLATTKAATKPTKRKSPRP